MALAQILYDLNVELHHLDRGMEARLSVRAARHPSETLERLWLRVLAYCWLYEERLMFGPGLCEPDAPDLFADDLTGQKTLWVRVGRPDPVKLQREADRARGARVAVLFESPRQMQDFVAAAREGAVTRLARVELAAIDPALLAWLASADQRRARISLTIVGDHLYLERGGECRDGGLTRAALG